MLGKLWSVIPAAAVAGFLAVPVSAATHPAGASHPAVMHHHRAMGCYDYAWQSKEMNDCVAKKTAHKPASHKHSTKKPS